MVENTTRYAVVMEFNEMTIIVCPGSSGDGKFDTSAEAEEFLTRMQAYKVWDPPIFVKEFVVAGDD